MYIVAIYIFRRYVECNWFRISVLLGDDIFSEEMYLDRSILRLNDPLTVKQIFEEKLKEQTKMC